MVCSIYIRVAIEAKYLLDRRTYILNYSMDAIDNDRELLRKVNIINIAICPIMLVIGIIGVLIRDGKAFALVNSIIANVLQVVYFIVWACALMTLFKKIKSI